jgi:hypothetical protein
MRIPHKVEIKPGIAYYVTYVDKFDDPNQFGYCLGEDSDIGCRTIQLKKGMSAAKTAKTFIHEVFHAIDFEWGIKIPHKLIDALEVPLYHLFTKNPSAFVASFAGAAKRKKKKRG